MRGLMMDRPLLVSQLIDYAADVHPTGGGGCRGGSRAISTVTTMWRRGPASPNWRTP